METEVRVLLNKMQEQWDIIAGAAETVETKKVSSKKARKATSELEKLGKSFRKATIAAEKKD